MAATYPVIEMTINGEALTFSGDQVVQATITKEISPLSTEVPMSTLEFTIYTTDPKFSIFSEGEYYQALSRYQPIRASEVINGRTLYLGHFYLDEWAYESKNLLKFTAIDLVGLLDGKQYDGVFYAEQTPAGTMIGAVLDPLNIQYTIDERIAAKELQGWIPPGTAREALQQICFAAGATIESAENGSLAVLPATLLVRNPVPDREITNDEKAMGDTVGLKPMVTSIELVSHDYTQGTQAEVIYSADLTPGDYKIVFEKPYHDVSATGVGYVPINLATEDEVNLATEGDDELVIQGEYTYGPNCIYLTVYEPGGPVEVTGTPWTDNQQGHVYTNADAPDEKRNDIRIDRATLVTRANAGVILMNQALYAGQRLYNDFTLLEFRMPANLYGSARPYGTKGTTYEIGPARVNSLAIVEIEGTKGLNGLIEKITYDLTGGFKPEIHAVGVENLNITWQDIP